MKKEALVLLVVLVAAGCGASSGGESRSTSEKRSVSPKFVQRSLFRDGKVVFQERCAVCHGEDADGAGTLAQEMESPKPADFRQKAYARMPVDSIRRVIVQGGKATGRNPRMPAWGDELTEAEIEAVIAFVRSVGRFEQIPTEKQVRTASWFVN